jgi:hypothetical protein
MGGGKWTSKDWDGYTRKSNITAQSTVKQIYKSTHIQDSLNPYGVKYRESCHSDDNPKSTAVIVGLDVTGSMGYLSEEIAKGALNTFINEMYDKKPITDPHIMIAAIGDAFSDYAPLQVTQFEADIRLAEQLTNIYFEGHGGGNDGESYLALWYFAARHTKIDCFDKDGRKGFLFTIGDEPNHKKLTKTQIKQIFGDDVERDLTAEELLTEVSRQYEVFHLCVGNYRGYDSLNRWKKLLTERAMEVTDVSKIPEIMESTMEVLGGKDVDTVASQWNGDTALAVKTAIGGLSAVKQSNSLVEF